MENWILINTYDKKDLPGVHDLTLLSKLKWHNLQVLILYALFQNNLHRLRCLL